jgi:hypothetical protein
VTSASGCFTLHSNLNSFHQIGISLAMTWKRISALLLFIIIARAVAEDIHSLEMSVITGSQFQCVNTTCLPYLVLAVLNVRDCRMACLSQVQCQAVNFHQSTTACALFTKILYQNIDMVDNVETATMMVISGTRAPPG